MLAHSRTVLQKTYVEGRLCVVVRFHSATEARLRLLSHCLFLLYGQSHRDTEAVVVTQGFSDSEVSDVESVVSELPWVESGRPLPRVINVPIPHKGDHRSLLINAGMDATNGQYLAFLDHDDIIYGGAYEYLIHRLEKTEFPISFANIKRVDVTPINGFYYQNRKISPFHGFDRYDMFFENFCPIHSFVIDRKRVDEADLWFDESMSKSEDYHFLVRLLAKYDGDFGGRYKFVGEYQVRTDGTNTINSEYQSDPTVRSSWEKAHKKMEELFETTTADVPISIIRYLKSELNNLGSGLSTQVATKAALEAARAEAESFKAGVKHLIKILAPAAAKAPNIGSLDLVSVDGQNVRVVGWAYDPDKSRRATCIAVVYRGSVLQVLTPQIPRSDVAEVFSLPFADVGFDVTMRLLGKAARPNEFEVMSILDDGTFCRITAPQRAN